VRASAALVLGEIGPHAQEAIPVLQAAVARSNVFDVMIAGSALEKIQRTRWKIVRSLTGNRKDGRREQTIGRSE